MADLSKTVEIIFSGNDKVSGVVSDIGTSLTAFEGLASPFAKLADGVLMLDAALALLTVGGIAAASYEAAKYEDATANLSKILTKQARESIPEVQDKMIELSNLYGTTSVAMMESTTNFKKAGFELAESAMLAEQAAKLVLAAAEKELQSAEATEIMISAMKGFGSEAIESIRLTDILNKTSNDYATSVTELGQGMAINAAVFKQMDFSMEESAAALTPVIEVFRSGNQAARSFKTTLLRLTSETKTVQKGLKLLGVEQKDNNGIMKTGKQIYQEVQEKYQGASSATQNLALQMIAGKMHAAKMAVAFNSLNYEAQILDNLMKNAAGSVQNEVNVKLNTASAAARQLVQGFQNILLLLGGEFLQNSAKASDSVVGLIRSITYLELAIQKMIKEKAFEELTEEVRSTMGRMGDYIKELTAALPDAWAMVDVSGMIEALHDLFGVFGDFGSNLDFTEVDDLAEGLQWLIDTVEALARLTEGMAMQFQPLWAALGEGINQINDLDESAQIAFGQLLGSAKLVVSSGAHIAAAFFVIQQSGAGMENVFNLVVGSIRAIWNTMQTAFDSMALIVLEAAQMIADTFGGIVRHLPGMENFDKALTDISDSIQSMQDGIKLDQIEQMEEVVDGASQAFRGLTGETREAREAIEDANEVIVGVETVSYKVDNRSLTAGLSAAELIAMDASVEISKNMSPAQIRAIVDEQSIRDAAVAANDAVGESARVRLGVDADTLTAEMEKAGILVTAEAEKIEEEAKISLAVEADKETVKKEVEYLEVEIWDQTGGKLNRILQVPVELDEKSVEKTKKDIKKNVTADKLLEIKTKLDIATLEAETDLAKTKIEETSVIVQKSTEWKAKLNIAEVEANTKKTVAAFDTINQSMESTGALMTTLFGALSGNLGTTEKWAILDQIDAENKIRQAQLDLQIRLTDAEIAYMEAKTQTMTSGEGYITIDGAGLQPHLESFMFEILKAIQIKASDEGAEFLLGIL